MQNCLGTVSCHEKVPWQLHACHHHYWALHIPAYQAQAIEQQADSKSAPEHATLEYVNPRQLSCFLHSITPPCNITNTCWTASKLIVLQPAALGVRAAGAQKSPLLQEQHTADGTSPHIHA
jgi:hypothetical protein